MCWRLGQRRAASGRQALLRFFPLASSCRGRELEAAQNLKSACAAAARCRWHPDKNRGAKEQEASEKFKEISEAYDVLSGALRMLRTLGTLGTLQGCMHGGHWGLRGSAGGSRARPPARAGWLGAHHGTRLLPLLRCAPGALLPCPNPAPT